MFNASLAAFSVKEPTAVMFSSLRTAVLMKISSKTAAQLTYARSVSPKKG